MSRRNALYLFEEIAPYIVKLPLYPFEIMSENYLLNEIRYSFMASYMWGVGGGSQIMTQYDRGGLGQE